MATMSQIKIDPITPAVGAVISGVDLKEALDPSTVHELRAAVLKHGAVFFREQNIEKRHTIALLKHFGRLTRDPYSKDYAVDIPDDDAVYDMETSNDNANATQYWHIDSSHGAAPASFLSLRALVLPKTGGGDTCWGSMYAAYESLAEPIRNMIDGMEAVHSDYRTYPMLDRESLPMLNKGLSNTHPVVRVHPETGRRALMVNALWTERLVGVSALESEKILDLLYAHSSQPRFTMRWRWAVNDLVIWDNAGFQHYAVRDYVGRRTLEKGIVAGERPFGPPRAG